MGQLSEWDVIVCGGGHAGAEAALASARLGSRTLLLTGNVDTIGQMSCNPAIGGLAKGHIVREIDALGGEMAVNADHTGIQFRLLNASKGAAVQGPRVQCDKKAYQYRLKHVLELQPNLSIFQATVSGLIFKGDRVIGCKTQLDIDFYAKAVVVTTGTFLRGLMHVGSNRTEGGRMGDYSAKTLSNSFLEAGIELDRLKTGTPPRLSGRSIDFSVMSEQPGDANPTLFGFYDTRDSQDMFHVEQPGQEYLGWTPGSNQVSCWMTWTSERSEQIVRDNLHRSALYGGEIKGIGPRYCPSIEDKFVKFAEKDRHLLFLEPEGRNTDEYYINGLSTSLPFDAQLDLVHSIPGLEKAHLIRPAYAVEYDYAPPTQIYPTLESKKVENLFFAGQINGTSGYEEAAGQGLLAGINATLKIRGEPGLVLERHEAYIGVLIDDLVTKGTREPYRMFTSRAEYRLLLNHHSAEIRLLHHLRRLPLVSPERLRRIEAKSQAIDQWVAQLEQIRVQGSTYGDWFRRQGDVPPLPEAFLNETAAVQEEVLYRLRYRGYLEKELKQIQRMREWEEVALDPHLDYNQIKGLRRESAQKLLQISPHTLGQASRISGVNPADIQVLMAWLKHQPAEEG
jgi:tRNA uridine 5-carboxymethylaminomethyl modification enzyme